MATKHGYYAPRPSSLIAVRPTGGQGPIFSRPTRTLHFHYDTLKNRVQPWPGASNTAQKLLSDNEIGPTERGKCIPPI